VALCVLLPTAAMASGRDVIRDCTDDEKFTKTYTQKEYRQALDQLSSDTDEYTNCRSVIRRAQLAAAADKGSGRRSGDGGSGSGGAGGGGAGTGGGATQGAGGTQAQPGQPAPPQPDPGPTAAERRALDAARTSNIDPSKLGTVPGVEQDSDLPTAVVALLVALGLAALGLGAARLRSLVLERRTA
jgi:hypothetical protein